MSTFSEYLNKAIGVPTIKPPETMRPVKPVHMQPHELGGVRKPVQNPGKHGSTQWYRDDQNKVVYGTKPTPRAHGFQGPQPSMEESNSYEPDQHHIPHIQTKTSHGWESDPTEANSYEPIQPGTPRPIKEFPRQHGIKPHHTGVPKPSSYRMPWTGHPVDSAVREWLHTNMPGQDEAEALTNLPIGYGKMFQQHFASKGLPVRSERPTPLSAKERIQFTARQAGKLDDNNKLVSKYPKLVENTRLRKPIEEPDSIDKLREHIAAAQDIMHERKAHLPHDFPPYPKQEGVGYALNQWKQQHPRNTTQNAVDFWSGLSAQEKEQVTQHVIKSVQSAQTPEQIHNIWGHPDLEATIKDITRKIATSDDPIRTKMLVEQLGKVQDHLASKLSDVDKLHEDVRESVRGFLANTSAQKATREAHHAWVKQTTNAKKLIGSVGPDGKWTHSAPEEPAHLDRHSETSIRQAWTSAILRNDLWIAKQEGDSTRLQDLKDHSTPEEFVKHMLPYFTRAIATQGQGEVTRFINSTADDARDVADDIYFALYQDGSRVDQYGKALKAPAKGKPLDPDAPSPERIKEFRSQMDTTFHRPTLKSMMAYGVEPLWVETLCKSNS